MHPSDLRLRKLSLTNFAIKETLVVAVLPVSDVNDGNVIVGVVVIVILRSNTNFTPWTIRQKVVGLINTNLKKRSSFLQNSCLGV
jgi:hypothetical protein